MRLTIRTFVCLLLACAAPVFLPQRASACGGFFCDSSQPVNQAAERIIFTHDADGTVTAVIQIQYAGPAETFAWVLPVAGTPEVDVSSNAAFQRLQAATNPRYTLTTRIEGTCDDDFSFGGGADAGFAAADAAVADPVAVVDRGSVGPYDYVTITVDPTAAPLADVAVDWLSTNGYDIDAGSAALLEPYLAGGMNLLAFRLTKGNDTGSIRPVTITFGTGLASIPIRPTAVAAVADMGVLVWMLGEHRAVPVNYMSLELNEALINWLSPGSTYDDVVNAAANEAGGQGFVTEMAGASAPLADQIVFPWERDAWSTLSTTDWTGREGELLAYAITQLGQLDGMRDVITEMVPLPEGVTVDELLSCFYCYDDSLDADIDGFEPSAFLAAMATQVIEPMERTRALFLAQPYVTRLYTTMSAAEMTRDPSFDFNPDLGDVSNVHTAERVIYCQPRSSRLDATWRTTLPDGQVVSGSGGTWPFSTTSIGMPANEVIRRVGTEGEGEVIVDNTAAIRAAIADHNASFTARVGDPEVADPDPVPSGGGCACRGAPSGSPVGILVSLLTMLGLVVLRRRS
jgi:MYXO-CTERM domain-containing protein